MGLFKGLFNLDRPIERGLHTYRARILADSIGPNGVRLTTWELTYPRFVHAELMTHRLFSRNSATLGLSRRRSSCARFVVTLPYPCGGAKTRLGCRLGKN